MKFLTLYVNALRRKMTSLRNALYVGISTLDSQLTTKCILRNHTTLEILHSTISSLQILFYVNYVALYETSSTKCNLRRFFYVYVKNLFDVYVGTVNISGKSNTLRERSTSDNGSLRNDTLRNTLYETQEVPFRLRPFF